MRFIFLLSISMLMMSAQVARACPVCFSAKEGQLMAYYGTTILMIILPFSIIGSVIYWVIRQVRTANATSEATPILPTN